MRLPRVRWTVRLMMGLVMVLGVSLGVANAVRMSVKAARYRRMADWCDRMEQRCRSIDAMDDATRTHKAEIAYDDPYLDNPEWNRKMIPYFEELKRTYKYAASHPRIPVPRVPPNP